MSDELTRLESWAAPLLARLDAPARRTLMRDLAKGLRTRQMERIKAQQNPDGSAFVPRKPQPQLRAKQGRIRREMFTKLAKAGHMKIRNTEGEAAVGFAGRDGSIANVHQLGLTGPINRLSRRTYKYPKREILGFTDADRAWVQDFLIEHLTS